jgi:DNA-binding NarL/FixJ family response regulator
MMSSMMQLTNNPRELTRRQAEVVELVARGHTNAEVASALGISLDGAKWHVGEVLGRLGVNSRAEAAIWWRREGRVQRPTAV